ncbi:MAG: DEAD/DEAH box helicase [Actinobacteria bacterium]|nr:DEAD/DEAH box helicase [Actinomycetota bacterium]
MPSASERFEAARKRRQNATSRLDDFASRQPFALDDFQLRACRALEAGRSVLVAAPTGSGKTVVGQFAVDLALHAGSRAFYTTPIKALSNQKYAELRDTYGSAKVGLLTGDNAINGDAQVVVMTTEVLRNMIYERSSALTGLGHVVMDEVHYLADRSRGAVWEEVLIQLPLSVSLTALSATVSNAEEFGAWLTAVRGRTEVVVEEHRPVPLFQHVMAGTRLYDLFVEGDNGRTRINPSLVGLAQDAQAEHRRSKRTGYQRRGRRGPRVPMRFEVIGRLQEAELLPAIAFIFSRAGCEAAAEQVAASGLRLTTVAEAEQIRIVAETRCAHLPQSDLALLGFDSWLAMLSRGIAAHHAGMLPTFKEVVEELFQAGLIKCVFATETLALGINMPARSVVLEKLTKWNGETHAEITPGEYTQLTGRAGRRGIDVEGHAVVVWHEGMQPQELAGLAATRTYPLRSSFHPSYNMAVNLVDSLGRHTAREVLETSFAQFQADQAVVGLATALRRDEEAAEGYAEAMTCHLGDFAEYSRLREQLGRREKELAKRSSAAERADITDSLGKLRRGDVIVVPAGRRAGPAVVTDPGVSDEFEPRPQVVTVDRQVRRLSAADFTSPVAPVTRMRVPKGFHPRSASGRRDLALALRERTRDLRIERPRGSGRRRDGAGDAEIAQLRAAIRRHPCHGCEDREIHARWAQRYHRLRREIDSLQRRVDQRTNTIARQFDRVCAVLAELGYLSSSGDDAEVTADGKRLARIYNENDLVAAEAIRQDLWADLDPAQLAAAASALVFTSRNPDDAITPRVPDQRVAQVLRDQARLMAQLKEVEREHRVAFLGSLDPGFARAAYSWVSGRGLPEVLDAVDLAAGDFVRWCKQLADFLDQIGVAAAGTAPAVAETAREAAVQIRRGVVDYNAELSA